MLVRVRKSNAKPCARKGKDNHKISNRCECEKLCESLFHFKANNSIGTTNHNNNLSISTFKGCEEVEKYLIDSKLIRYEAKEKSGLDVLFTGIEKLHSMGASCLEIDNLGETDFPDDELTVGEAINSSSYELDNNQLFEEVEEFEELELEPNLYIDESVLSFAPASLGYGHSMAHDIFACAPENLEEVAFNYLFKLGEFEKGPDDLIAVAKCIKQRRDLPKDIKQIWPKYTPKRFKKYQDAIEKIIKTKSPFWMIRFDEIWKKLSKPQAEAIRTEYFHSELEKPTQKESAKKLGISIASYQERLEWAYKKLEKLFPEFRREPRRNKNPKQRNSNIPAPLYQIIKNGDRIKIPFPVPKEIDAQ